MNNSMVYNSEGLAAAKNLVAAYHQALDAALRTGAGAEDMRGAIGSYLAPRYGWRGVYPFYEHDEIESVINEVFVPLGESFTALQRRPLVFLASPNREGDGHKAEQTWVFQMGVFMGLHDRPWLGIPPTGRLTTIRFAEFHRVDGERIVETTWFIDLLSIMRQAGVYPLGPTTGAPGIFPGPLTNDGVLWEAHDPSEAETTMALVDRMVDDLTTWNKIGRESGDDRVPPEVLRECWHEDMAWYGPDGIGATYTIERYQHQHQYPFRFGLGDKVFNGHVARLAEGNYACFFGWSNLTNTARGGFLGLPGGQVPADMRVVDVYRRDGDKLAENWIFIDLPHWLSMQGLDVLVRMRQLRGEATFENPNAGEVEKGKR